MKRKDPGQEPGSLQTAQRSPRPPRLVYKFVMYCPDVRRFAGGGRCSRANNVLTELCRRLVCPDLVEGKGAEAKPGALIIFYLGSIRSSGRAKKILPRPFFRMPWRCHSPKARLTVNGVTLAPAARSSFPTRISTPS